MIFWLWLSLASAAAEPTVPGFLDAAQLVGLCRSPHEAERALCLGYVAGAMDQLLTSPDGGRSALCPPVSATPQQAVEAVLAAAGPSAAIRQVAASGLVRVALELRWSCPAGSSRR